MRFVSFGFVALGAVSGGAGQDDREELPSDVAPVRTRIRIRIDRWLADTREGLLGKAGPPERTEEIFADLRSEVGRILDEELRGRAVIRALRIARGEKRTTAPEPSLPTAPARYAARFEERADFRKSPSGEALDAALLWLRAHMHPDGYWSAAEFSKQCRTRACDGPGIALHDVGVTGLALLAFLGDGNTTSRGPHRDVVAQVVAWLLRQQDAESGLFGTRSDNAFLYRHAIATLALAEVYAFSRSPEFRGPLERAVAFCQEARNPGLVWRYHHPPEGENDTSVTGWMVFALKAAEDAGIPVDEAAFESARAWFDRVTGTSENDKARVGYTESGQLSSRRFADQDRFPATESEALTSVGLLCRVFLGDTPESRPVLNDYVGRLLRKPPRWEVTPDRSTVDEYYWYYGSLATWQMGRVSWRPWEAALSKALLGAQRQDGDARGSWDPVGAWGVDGGRVYMTAICALCLEAPFRYARLAGSR